MTELAPSALLVALVQTATNLPVFLLAVPAGAAGDLFDRRKLLLVTQGLMLAAAAVLGVMTLTGSTGPWTLLWLTFALGLGATMNGPTWQAIMPDLVPNRSFRRHRAQLRRIQSGARGGPGAGGHGGGGYWRGRGVYPECRFVCGRDDRALFMASRTGTSSATAFHRERGGSHVGRDALRAVCAAHPFGAVAVGQLHYFGQRAYGRFCRWWPKSNCTATVPATACCWAAWASVPSWAR